VDQPAVPNLLSRAEVLRALPARRASTLVYAIECRTAQRIVRTRQATARLANERTAEQQERVLRLRQNRFLLGAVPVTLIFSLAEWLLAQGVSFAGPIGLLGVLAYSVLGGVLPALMLFAGRRKGDYVPAVA